VQKERAIVSLPVVVTGHAEAKRNAQNQQGWRERPPMVMRIDQRRIKRREIRAPLIEFAFEGAKRGINPEAAQDHDYRNCFHPPGVTAQRAAQASCHCGTSGRGQSSTSQSNWKANQCSKWQQLRLRAAKRR